MACVLRGDPRFFLRPLSPRPLCLRLVQKRGKVRYKFHLSEYEVVPRSFSGGRRRKFVQLFLFFLGRGFGLVSCLLNDHPCLVPRSSRICCELARQKLVRPQVLGLLEEFSPHIRILQSAPSLPLIISQPSYLRHRSIASARFISLSESLIKPTAPCPRSLLVRSGFEEPSPKESIAARSLIVRDSFCSWGRVDG